VTVFFCGPEGLERTLRQICTKLDLPFRNEVF
jgi:predicted ferric reductase